MPPPRAPETASALAAQPASTWVFPDAAHSGNQAEIPITRVSGNKADESGPGDMSRALRGGRVLVALEYDSQAGTDMLGVGWKIADQSQITRCGKTQLAEKARLAACSNSKTASRDGEVGD